MDKSLELTNAVSQFIFNTLESQDLKIKINSIIIENIKDILLLKNDNIFSSDTYLRVKENMIIKILDICKSDNLKKQMKSIIHTNLKKIETNSNLLKDIIPNSLIDSIKSYIYSNSSALTNMIKKFLNSSKVQRKILLEVNNSIGSMNPLASMFINPSFVYSKISYSINSYFDNPKNNKDIADMVVKYLESFLEKRLSEVLSSISAENKSALIESMVQNLNDYIITKETLESILCSVEENFKENVSSNNNIRLKIYCKFEDLIDINFDNIYDKVISNSNFRSTINEFSAILVEGILNMHIKDFVEPSVVNKNADIY